MIRNPKALGLALMAVFAMSAVAASGASANSQGELTADGPVTLTGEEKGENYFEAFGQQVECPGSTYTGHGVLSKEETEEAKEHQPLESGATDLTITPHYDDSENNCRTGGGLFVTINEDGCDLIFQLGEASAEHSYDVTADLTCLPSQTIDVSFWLNAGHSIFLCTLTVGTQKGLTGLTAFHDTENNDVQISGLIENLKVTRHEGICGEEETIGNGKLQLNVTVSGHDELGEPTDVTVTDETSFKPPHETTDPEAEGQLTSDGPVTLTGEEIGEGENYFEVFGQKISCPGSTYTGHAVLGHEETEPQFLESGATGFTITPHFDDSENNCRTGSGLFITMEENGCDFVFHLGEKIAEHDYEIVADLTCPAGQAIDRSVWLNSGHTIGLCTETIVQQEGLTGLKATHDTENDDVQISGAIENLKITRHEGSCGSEATTESAKLVLNLTIEGHDELGDPTEITVTDREAG